MAFDIKALNEKTSKGSLATLIIVCALLVVTAVSLCVVVINSNTTDKSTKLFESAFVQILEFNEQTNVYSKQEMAPDILSDLDAVIASYPNTTAGARAVFYKGYVYYSTENYDEALAYFQLFIKKFSSSPLAGKAYYYISYCYSAKNDNDNAISILEEFEKKFKDSYYISMFDLRLGELYEAKDKAVAAKYYKKIIDSKDSSSQKDLAAKRLALIENDMTL
ncbi:MAG: tetratricopeptide repeat protein [Spirochaetales bacterium]|nr:tetratricopeptide repeat protein [Spirochaetales bacterium]